MLKKITILEALNKCMTTIKEYIGLVADKKVDKVEGKCLTTNDLTDQLVENYNTAYNHSQEPHAPSDAQKNSDITKAEIEAKLTGQIDTHFHDLSEDLSEYDRRLDVSENKIENINQEITNTIKPTLNTHETKLNNIEAINTEQNNRLEAIEIKNQEQDNRINALETNDKIQDINIKALFTTSDIMDIEEEGNSLSLHNSKRGFAVIDEIKGNTLVNCNKEPDKELILNGNINDSADNTVTLTEGVDGGLVDVALEGNTLVNVSKTKDSTGISMAYTVENSGNHVALQGDIDGNCRPVIKGNTLVNLCTNSPDDFDLQNSDGTSQKIFIFSTRYNLTPGKIYTLLITFKNVVNNNNYRYFFRCNDNADGTPYDLRDGIHKIVFTMRDETEIAAFDIRIPVSYITNGVRATVSNPIILEGDYSNKPIPNYFEGLQSTFEDNLVTQEMVDNREEEADNLGKYRVDYKVTGKNKLNETPWTSGSIDPGTGNEFELGSKIRSGYIPFSPCNFYLSGSNPIGDSWYYCYDKNKNLIFSGNFVDGFGKSAPLGTAFLRLALEADMYNGGNIQIEEGDTATAYEPYKEYTKTLYLNSPLLEGDTIEEKDNDIYHVHRSELSAYTEGDETSLITDKVNTLHQLETPTYELIEQSNLVIPSYANGHLDFNTAVPVEKVDFLPFSEGLTYLYANTQYTLQFISTKAITADITLGGTSLLAQSILEGLNRISITTPETLVDNKLTIDGVGAKISEVVVTDTNRKFGYFEGMKSVGECEELEVNSHTQNLWDWTKSQDIEVINAIKNSSTYNELEFTLNDDMSFNVNGTATANFQFINIINLNLLEEGSVYGVPYGMDIVIEITKKDGSLSYVGEFSYTKDIVQVKVAIGFAGTKTYNNLLIKPILRKLNNGETRGNLSNDKFKLHKINTQQLTHEPLRAVREVKDRYVLIDGKWYIERNCAEVVLDGSDDEKWGIDTNGVMYIAKTSWNGLKHKPNTRPITNNIPSSTTISDVIDKMWMGNSYIFSINTGGTLSEWLNYLANNPLTVIYQLETPIYEPIDYNPLEVYSDVTHISTNSTIPCNVTVKNHGYNCILKPSTTYTISSNLGLNTVTTGADIGDSCLRFMDTNTSDVTTMKNVLVLEGDWTSKSDLIPAHFAGMESAFEQELVTDEADANYGKYKVNIKVTNEDKTKENNITFYINEPLRGVGDVKDRVYVKDDKIVIQRNCGVRSYEDGDFGTYITDKVNTVYPLAEPTYEEVEYFNSKLYMEIFNNSTLFYNSNVPLTSKVHYSYSVPLVDKVSQTANISDEQDQLIIDMAVQVSVLEIMTL